MTSTLELFGNCQQNTKHCPTIDLFNTPSLVCTNIESHKRTQRGGVKHKKNGYNNVTKRGLEQNVVEFQTYSERSLCKLRDNGYKSGSSTVRAYNYRKADTNNLGMYFPSTELNANSSISQPNSCRLSAPPSPLALSSSFSPSTSSYTIPFLNTPKNRPITKKCRLTNVKKIILMDRVGRNVTEMEKRESADVVDEQQTPRNEMREEEQKLKTIFEKGQAQKVAEGKSQLRINAYVTQALSQELDDKIKHLLKELTRFQDRIKDTPLLRHRLQRYILGLSSARRAVDVGKLKCLILAPNIEETVSEGGLTDLVSDLIVACHASHIPVVFGLSRNLIGKVCSKNMRQSCVGIVNPDGAYDVYQEMIAMAKLLKEQRQPK